MYKISYSCARGDFSEGNSFTTKIAKIYRCKNQQMTGKKWVSLNNEPNNYISGCHGNDPGPEIATFSKSIKSRLVTFLAFP